MIRPQPGFQTDFLASSADICIGGGAAGVGKTYAELLEPLYHKNVPGFTAVFFRRTSVQIRNPGGLWDKSSELYPQLGGRSREQQMDWTFPSGAVVKFSHLEHESNIYDHQGTEYCLIVFDELTHFTKKMFFYLLSRNRSMCGVKPYIRATCNPDPDSFVAELVDWWIDTETGYPIPERAGVLRYFLVDNDNFVWGDNKQQVIEQCPHIFNDPVFAKTKAEDLIKSITFIPGEISQNKKLLDRDPAYLANLMALPEEEKVRLLGGNWKIRTDELCLFNYSSIDSLFLNEYPSNVNNRYITVDAARFGNDFMTMFVWYGWKVVKLVVLTKCDANEAVDAIEKEREAFKIIKGNVIVDQDGVGSGVVKLGNYKGFSGGAQPIDVREVKGVKENYYNLKTQCYYRLADKVNVGEISICLNNENVVIDGYYGVKIKIHGKVVDVRELIKADLRSIRKKELDPEGKMRINTKEEQKVLLKGRSPDFGDALSTRIVFDLKSSEIVTSTGKKGLLDRI
ncbi:MAG: terminase family protein [Flavobacteriales bacterium]|nr:terminase family protein [Flavobacteriales bacterium]